MKCRFCKAQIPDDTQFCPNCGHELAPDDTQIYYNMGDSGNDSDGSTQLVNNNDGATQLVNNNDGATQLVNNNDGATQLVNDNDGATQINNSYSPNQGDPYGYNAQQNGYPQPQNGGGPAYGYDHKKPGGGKSSPFLYVSIGVGAVLLLVGAWFLVSSLIGNSAVNKFADSFAGAVNSRDMTSLMAMYPGLSENDSLAVLPADKPKIEKVQEGDGKSYKIAYGDSIAVIVRDYGDDKVSVVESFGLLLFPEEKVDYAKSKSVWLDGANDLAHAEALRDPGFIDAFKRDKAVLTDERIRDVIKKNKCTKMYNLVAKVFDLAVAAQLEYEGDWGDPYYSVLDSYEILSQSDNVATVAVDYYDNYTNRKSQYLVTLKKEKLPDSTTGEDIYVWLIDDVENHPEWAKNRSSMADYINGTYSEIQNHGGASNYWDDVFYSEYGDPIFSSKDEYLKAANKFTSALKEYFPGGIAQ